MKTNAPNTEKLIIREYIALYWYLIVASHQSWCSRFKTSNDIESAEDLTATKDGFRGWWSPGGMRIWLTRPNLPAIASALIGASVMKATEQAVGTDGGKGIIVGIIDMRHRLSARWFQRCRRQEPNPRYLGINTARTARAQQRSRIPMVRNATPRASRACPVSAMPMDTGRRSRQCRKQRNATTAAWPQMPTSSSFATIRKPSSGLVAEW